MSERPESKTTSQEGLLIVERVFDAPHELVWKALTDPEMITRWWGPRSFTAPAVEVDFRVGGKWLFAMQSADFNEGRPIWSTGVYKEIVPFERIVYTDCFADENGNVVSASHYGMTEDFPMETVVVYQLEDLGGRTKLTVRHEGMPGGEMGEGAGVGWSESLDKLAESLA